MVKTLSSRFTVSTLNENLSDLSKQSCKKASNVAIVVPQLNLKSNLYDGNQNSLSQLKRCNNEKKTVSLKISNKPGDYEKPGTGANLSLIDVLPLNASLRNLDNSSRENVTNKKNKVERDFIPYCEFFNAVF